tara:strand:- start:27387 stop:28034 length:648 start_codon:yes stop_codon:yes gene_type:complete
LILWRKLKNLMMIKRDSIYWAYKEFYNIYVNVVKNRIRALFATGRHIKINAFVNHFSIKCVKESKLAKDYIRYYRYQFPEEMYPSNLDVALEVMHNGQINFDLLDANYTAIIKKAEEAGIIKYCQEARTFWDLPAWQNIANLAAMGTDDQRHIFSSVMVSVEEALRMYLWECLKQRIELLDIIDGIENICNNSIEVLPVSSDLHWLERIAINENW